MKAIPTIYGGIQFRSRLEVKWAMFFDQLGEAWDYEAEGYTNGGQRYLPDFWMPSVWHRGKRKGLFFEVKPSSPIASEVDKAVMLACGSGKPVIVVAASPRGASPERLSDFVKSDGLDWEDSGLSFARCKSCGVLDVDYYGSRWKPCPSCNGGSLNQYDAELEQARAEFPNYARWEPAA